MSATFDQTKSGYGGQSSTTTTLTGVGVTAGGGDRLLTVTVHIAGAGTVSSVAYGGVALTLVDAQSNSGSNRRVEIWRLIAPTAGTANVVVVLSALGTVHVVATSWVGIDQTTPTGTAVKATGNNAAPTVTASPAAGAITIDAMAGASGNDPTVASGQTLLKAFAFIGASYKSGGTAMTWACATGQWCIVAVPLNASGTTTPAVTGASATVTVSEMRIVPVRAAPAGFSVQATGSVVLRTENQAAQWEATGLYPKVLMGTIDGAEIVYDDVWTLPSVAPSGVIAFTGMPTANSPSGSLVATTQDLIVTYPFPYGVSTNIIPYPRFARSRSDASYTTDLVPSIYLSTWDAGDVPHTLVGIHIIAEQMTPDVDRVGISWRWGDTAPWSVPQFASNADAWFEILGENFGTKLSVCVTIYDAVTTDPIGPGILSVIPWVEELEVDGASLPEQARSDPEGA